jgi:peptidoglycan/LPS O-acetylase OafA/YrhL
VLLKNNFDFLRVSASLMVILGHSYPLLGSPSPMPSILQSSISTFAVYIFFSISGFLITKSYLSDPRVKVYLYKRFLRIYPAYFIVITACLFFGFVGSVLDFFSYFSNSNTILYLKNLIFFPIYSLPGVFENRPYPSAVNGSIWTLPIEVAAYLLILVVLIISKRGYRFIFTLLSFLLIVFIWQGLPVGSSRVVFFGSPVKEAMELFAFFISGSLVAQSERYFKIRLDFAFCFLVILQGVNSISPADLHWFTPLLLPYIVISFGLATTPVVSKFGRFGDPSYGAYLWAWPIQQTVIGFWGPLPVFINFILVAAFSLLAGYLSWHFFEKRFLRLKARINKSTPLEVQNES